MATIFRGYRTGVAGAGLVTITTSEGDERPLGLPALLKNEPRHSPDGFNWGYRGSGPAELARAILIAVYPDDLEMRHPRAYQGFKNEVIAALKVDEWTLRADVVEAWVAEWRRQRVVPLAEPFI